MRTALLLAALATSFAPRVDSHALVPRCAQGDVFQERERFWSQASGPAEDDAANRPSFGWAEAVARAGSGDGSVVASESTLDDEILEVRDGARVKVRRTFVSSSRASVDPESADAAPRRVAAPFEGQSVVLVADGSGTRLVGEIDGEEELAPGELDLAPRWERALPPTPVEIGDSWTLSEEVAARLLEPLTPRKASASCKLVAVEAGESGPVACVQLEVHGTAPGALGETTEIESSGRLRWDLAGGHLIEVTLAGETHTTDREGDERSGRFGIVHETHRSE